MFKQSITYTDYDGAERTDDFYFNLTKTDLDKRTNLIETHDLTNCKNCGAPLSRYPCKCEYCGTVYGMIDKGVSTVDEARRMVARGVMSVNEARGLLGLDRQDERIANIALRTEFINQILSKH